MTGSFFDFICVKAFNARDASALSESDCRTRVGFMLIIVSLKRALWSFHSLLNSLSGNSPSIAFCTHVVNSLSALSTTVEALYVGGSGKSLSCSSI